jgi:DNA-binding NtrC family response regulator
MRDSVEFHVFLGMPAVVGSEPMRGLLEFVRRVAKVDAAVLITGESGTGKELIARALHHYSPRAARPWVDVSCAALPEHLIESELFGHEKGAYSGADSAKPGLFELANKGTLLLDEIAELEPKMQVKLLRVLDGVPYYRLGGVRKVSVNVRVLAATNGNLEESVKAGRFRSDLYHRLSGIQLEVPPLRDRRRDILPLAEYFLREHNPEFELREDARKVLEDYSWPGNVRELRNVVLKTAVLAQSPVIGGFDLRAHLGPGWLESASAQAKSWGAAGVSEAAGMNLDGMERRMIFRVLEQTGGHQQRAAKLLGISRRTLSRKLRLYAVQACGRELEREQIN